MGIFDRIKGAIFGRAEAAPTATAQAPTGAAAAPKTSAPSGSAAPQPSTPTGSAAPQPSAPTGSVASTPAPAGSAATAPAPAQAVDVAAILNEAVAAKGQKLNWRTSIVDMMEALDMDSSLAERKELAAELGYTGSTGDSAAMNMWLHKALLKRLAENGGKVPADLLD